MMCHKIGFALLPISTIGLGFKTVSSDRRVPRPPARITTFMFAKLTDKTVVSKNMSNFAVVKLQIYEQLQKMLWLEIFFTFTHI